MTEIELKKRLEEVEELADQMDRVLRRAEGQLSYCSADPLGAKDALLTIKTFRNRQMKHYGKSLGLTSASGLVLDCWNDIGALVDYCSQTEEQEHYLEYLQECGVDLVEYGLAEFDLHEVDLLEAAPIKLFEDYSEHVFAHATLVNAKITQNKHKFEES